MKGLYIGRFDPFHLGHLKAYDLFSSILEDIQIGIGAQRDTDFLSLEERKKMVYENTGVNTIELEDLTENHPLYWDWGRYVLEDIDDIGIVATGNDYVRDDFVKNNIPVLWLPRYRGISGTSIRRKIDEGNDSWQLLVPEKTKTIITNSKKYQGRKR